MLNPPKFPHYLDMRHRAGHAIRLVCLRNAAPGTGRRRLLRAGRKMGYFAHMPFILDLRSTRICPEAAPAALPEELAGHEIIANRSRM